MVTFHEMVCLSWGCIMDWSASITYAVNSVVKKDSKFFIALQDSVDSDPTQQWNTDRKEINQTQFE